MASVASNVTASATFAAFAAETITREAFTEYLKGANYAASDFWKTTKQMWVRLPREERSDAALEIQACTPFGIYPHVRSLMLAMAGLCALPEDKKRDVLSQIHYRAPEDTYLKTRAANCLASLSLVH